jgi:hypothetical protein
MPLPAARLQEAAWQLLDALGLQYEREHEKDLAEPLRYLPPEAHGLGWQTGQADALRRLYTPEPTTTAPATTSSTAAGKGSSSSAAAAAFRLPQPFVARARLGTRLLVQCNFSRLAPALAGELSSWQAEPRRRAAQLLRSCLVLIEEACGGHLATLLPAMCKVSTALQCVLYASANHLQTVLCSACSACCTCGMLSQGETSA